MGKITKREVVGVRCNIRQCGETLYFPPVAEDSAEAHQEETFRPVVDAGWALVMLPRMRSYCPNHTERVWQCTCYTNPDYQHLCVEHGDDSVKGLVWVPDRQTVSAG